MLTQSTPTWKTFYQKLGHLCYAIAAADKKVSKAEVNEVKKLVTNDWLNVEASRDEFGADASHQIEIVFDWLTDNAPASEEAFTEFSDFCKTHPAFLTAELRDNILKTANAIAAAFHDKNKAEAEMLSRLKRLLRA